MRMLLSFEIETCLNLLKNLDDMEHVEAGDMSQKAKIKC